MNETIKSVLEGIILILAVLITLYAFFMIFETQVDQIHDQEEWRKRDVFKIECLDENCTDFKLKKYEWR
jgi:hypothetical protein